MPTPNDLEAIRRDREGRSRGEAIVTTNLGACLVAFRRSKRIGVRECARAIGLSAATLNRIERGHTMQTQQLILLLAWLITQEMI